MAYGRKPADYDPAAFQGIHARYVLVIIDEAGGVPKSIFDAVDALATNIDARVVAVGNPDDPASHFATICKPGTGWHVETISAFDTPAYTGEKVPEELLPLLVSPEWVEERKIRWGVNSPIYQSKVLGEFPDISNDALILPKWIEAAQKRTLERTRRPIIAADIARFGEDETVIMRREGGWIRVYRAHHKADTMVTSGHIAKAMRDIDDEAGKNDWVRAIVDVPGVGGGVVDRLAELDLPVIPYNGGEAPIDMERFVNARAEDYWTLRERFEQGEVDIDPTTTSSRPSSGRSSGASTPVVGSRSNRRTTFGSVACPHPTARTPQSHDLFWQGKCCADECGESCRRVDYWRLDEQGVVETRCRK